MKIEVRVPSFGESIVTGILTKWLVKNDDPVAEGDNIFELETDKATAEVPSPASGKIEILAKEGDEVKIDQVVAYIDTDYKPEKKEPKETGEKNKLEEERAKKDSTQKEKKDEKQATDENILKTSPSVRRIAGENKIDLDGVKGTGRDGRILKQDVLDRLLEKSGANEQTVVKMSPIRRTIAKRLVQAKQEAAHLTTFNEINMEHVINLRIKHKDDFINKYGIKLGFMSFFVKACCQALKEFPDVNTMVRGEEIVYYHYCNIGIAVAVDEGLIVPVLKNADRMSFAQIEQRISELAQKAKDRKITVDDLQGGTFTITNGGIFGSMMSTPIPSFPQTAILGMHAITDRPYVVDGRIEIKPIMYAALTYDHRVIDGREAVSFLMSIKKYIEDPESLLIEL